MRYFRLLETDFFLVQKLALQSHSLYLRSFFGTEEIIFASTRCANKIWFKSLLCESTKQGHWKILRLGNVYQVPQNLSNTAQLDTWRLSSCETKWRWNSLLYSLNYENRLRSRVDERLRPQTPNSNYLRHFYVMIYSMNCAFPICSNLPRNASVFTGKISSRK